MTLIQSIILGIVQGLTEFLPISSSAHLVLVPAVLNWQLPETEVFVFDVLVQIGTLVAVIVYYWNDLLVIVQAFLRGLWQRQPFANPHARLGWYLILATVPAGIGGILIKDQIEATFNNPQASALFLIGTAVLLLIAERVSRQRRSLEGLRAWDALIIGIFQAIAMFPGISRSGSTISGAILLSFKRADAARFSFLMSVPVMLAAGLFASIDLVQTPNLTSQLPNILAGFLAAAVVGYLSIRWFLGYLKRQPLYGFAIYCLVFGILSLLLTAR